MSQRSSCIHRWASRGEKARAPGKTLFNLIFLELDIFDLFP